MTTADRLAEPLASRFVAVRVTGAAIAGVLALATLSALFILASDPHIEAILSIRFLLGPSGFVLGEPARLVTAWTAGPTAAAVLGWRLAPRVAGGDRWSGPWLGVGTFYGALTVNLLVALSIDVAGRLAAGEANLVSGAAGSAFGVPLILLVATAVLAPLLGICAAAGFAWGVALRVVARYADMATPAKPANGTSLAPLLLCGAAVALLWLLLGDILTFPEGFGD
jgi:hypothetical protein